MVRSVDAIAGERDVRLAPQSPVVRLELGLDRHLQGLALDLVALLADQIPPRLEDPPRMVESGVFLDDDLAFLPAEHVTAIDALELWAPFTTRAPP